MKLTSLKSLGPKKEKIFNKSGIFNIKDLIYSFPKRFENRTKKLLFLDSQTGYFKGRVISRSSNIRYSKKSVQKILVTCNGYIIELIFFNSPYINRVIKIDEDYYIYGKLEKRGKSFQMIHPQFINSKSSGINEFLTISPIYPFIKGISNNEYIKFVKQALKLYNEEVFFEEDLRKLSLMGIKESLNNMHFPKSRNDYRAAKYRIIFEEFFLYLIDNRKIKKNKSKIINIRKPDYFKKLIKFKLTNDQENSMLDIRKDLKSGNQMVRLIQADVGSGKSVIAYYAIFETLKKEHQIAYLAPTQLLATEQYQRLLKLFDKDDVVLLHANIKNKNDVYNEIKNGEKKIIVGTHSIFQEKTKFKNLELIIIDEQQRFGIEQRNMMAEKGLNPHILMLSATPIPRTLSMILNKNIDVSYVNDKPGGRLDIITKIIKPDKINCIYDKIKEEANKNNKSYIIYARIEEGEEDISSIESEEKKLKEIFGDNIDFLHGKMESAVKDLVLKRFRDSKINILASTSVVEVGIDVKDATIILINDSSRFGLSQLHQMRGRVGRSHKQSYAYLVSNNLNDERLKILENSSDGFKISNEDLRLRGPGEIRGTKQHGNFSFNLGDLYKHEKILMDVNAFINRDIINKYVKRQLEVKF